jgi:hypothetical protein
MATFLARTRTFPEIFGVEKVESSAWAVSWLCHKRSDSFVVERVLQLLTPRRKSTFPFPSSAFKTVKGVLSVIFVEEIFLLKEN